MTKTSKSAISQYLHKNGFGTFSPKAVLFDMDGVLFDSMPAHAVSWHKAMESFGIAMSEADAYKYEGMRGVETIRTLCREQWGRDISEQEAQEMYAVKSRIFAGRQPAGTITGVRRLMQMIKKCGVKICVVTGSGQSTLLDKLLREFDGLLSKDLIVTSFDVGHGKPAPDPYLMGLSKCGVQPWEAVVVENAPLGIQAAVAAKIFTVAVNTGPLPDEMLSESGADLVLHDMAALARRWNTLKKGLCGIGEKIGKNEQWERMYAMITDYVVTNKRRPSKHRTEDKKMHNWLKYNKKVLNAGKMKEERVDKFDRLLALIKKYRRLNNDTYLSYKGE